MKDSILKHWNNSELPYGVRILTMITSIRWIGWGFAETLIPVMIYSFGHSFAEAGLLRSGYEIALILSLPLIGIAADRMKATTLLLIGLSIYLFVGTSYLLAGVTGLAIFIISARLLNGVAYGFDSVGRQTYFMRHTPKAMVATAFGYLDTVADFWWIVAALIGIILIKFFSIPTLLFLIVPSSLVCILMLIRFRKKEAEMPKAPLIIQKVSHKFTDWNVALKSLTVFNFFIMAVSTIVAFFVPIQAYNNGATLPEVILMGVIVTIPTLFGWDLGKLFDVKGSKLFTAGLLLSAVILFGLVFLTSYIWQVVFYFAMNMVLELLSVGSSELISIHAEPEHFGKVNGFMRSTGYIGALTGPLIAGIIMDSFGAAAMYAFFAMIMIVLTIIFYFFRRKGVLNNPLTVSETVISQTLL